MVTLWRSELRHFGLGCRDQHPDGRPDVLVRALERRNNPRRRPAKAARLGYQDRHSAIRGMDRGGRNLRALSHLVGKRDVPHREFLRFLRAVLAGRLDLALSWVFARIYDECAKHLPQSRLTPKSRGTLRQRRCARWRAPLTSTLTL